MGRREGGAAAGVPWAEVVSHVPVGLFQADAEGGYGYVNAAWSELTGLAAEEAKGDGWMRALHEEDRERVVDGWRRAVSEGVGFDSTFRFVHASGTVTWVLGRAAPICVEAEGGFAGSVTSIDAQKRAEERALEGESRFRDVADQAPVMIGVTDAEGHITFLNKTWLDFRGKTLEEEEGWAWAAGLHPEDRDRTCATMERCIARREPYSVEYRIEDREGRHHWMLDTAIPRLDRNGELLGYIGTAVMIDAQKRLESRLREELAQKETLLREVHHRVKNNLQMVSSFIYFQSRKASSDVDKQGLADLRERLRAMSIVHETLFQSDRLSSVELGEYAHTLATSLHSSAALSESIVFVVDAEPVRLPLDRALPVGLILCELLMNVGKYAFADRSAGLCRIEIRQEGGHAVVRVRDDGKGFPPDFDAAAGGEFGWNLVRSLVRQLRGEVEATNAGGADVVVRFPRCDAEPP